MRKITLGFAFGALFWAAIGSTPALAGDATAVTVYKSPYCGCCGGWSDHMRQSGYDVTEKTLEDMDPVKQLFGIPDDLRSCHTAVIDGYVFEGHVPASDVARVLDERPAIKGLSAPGMPADAPGMDAATGEPYDVISFDAEGKTTVYATH